MGFSPLIVGRWPLGTNKVRYGPRVNIKTGRQIDVDMFIVHHAAGTSTDGLRKQFTAPSRELSSTYGMAQNGDIYGVLDERYRPFTSSTWLADARAVTIEITNEQAAPSWKISDRAFDQLARLIADVATRHGFPIDRNHVIGHRQVIGIFKAGKSTECPGPWLYSRMDELCARARKYQAEGQPSKPVPTTPTPAPAVPSIGDVRVGSLLRLSSWTAFDSWDLTGRRPQLVTGEFEVIGIAQGNFRVVADGVKVWVANAAKAGLVAEKTPEQIEEEELMGAIDEVKKLTEDVKEAVRREARPRLYERRSTGELLLIKVTSGYLMGPWDPKVEPHKLTSLLQNGYQLVTEQEIANREVVADQQWESLQREAKAHLGRIAVAVADELSRRQG